MGHLNKQVIHHLYPSMPQFRQSQVSRMLCDLCVDTEMRYTIVSYPEAARITFEHLHKVGKQVAAQHQTAHGAKRE